MISCRATLSVAADPDRIWRVIGDFVALRDWHPAIASCVRETVGGDTIRVITTRDGAVLREKLVAHSDAERRYSYTIEKSPLPVTGYRSSLSVKPLAEGRSLVAWHGTFEPSGATADAAVEVIDGVYSAGLENLAKILAQ